MTARACSARAAGTVTETRRRSFRPAQRRRSGASRRTPRRVGTCPRSNAARTARAGGAARAVSRRGTAHVDEHALVAAAEALEHRHALAAKHAHLARLRARLELELGVAFERRHGDRRAERRLDDVRSHGRDDVVRRRARAARPGRRAPRRRHHRPGRRSRPRDPRRASGSAGRRGSRQGSRRRAVVVTSVRPWPSHSEHGVSTIRPLPAQRGQAPARTNSPKTLRETCCTRPAPAHVEHVDRRRARLGAVAGAASAGRRDLELDVPRDARVGLGELDLDPRRGIAAAAGRRTASGTSEEVVAEEGREDVAEVAEVEVAWA